MLKTGRLFRANSQPAHITSNLTPPKKSGLPAFLRKKPQELPAMVVATIK